MPEVKSRIPYMDYIQAINFIHCSRFWLKALEWGFPPLLFLVLMTIEQILREYGRRL